MNSSAKMKHFEFILVLFYTLCYSFVENVHASNNEALLQRGWVFFTVIRFSVENSCIEQNISFECIFLLNSTISMN